MVQSVHHGNSFEMFFTSSNKNFDECDFFRYVVWMPLIIFKILFLIGYTFKSYSDRTEVEANGLAVGTLYVGGGTYNGEFVVTMLEFDTSGCYTWDEGLEVVLPRKDCVYLVNQPGNFTWIPSSNGTIEDGAVMYKSRPIGRARHNKKLIRVGEILPQQNCIIYVCFWYSYKKRSYEALIYKPQKPQ